MFRCPSDECRQQDKGFKLTGQKINVKFVDENTFTANNESIDIKDFMEKHKKHKMVCNECDHSGKAFDFRFAFEKPMAAFNTDNLCSCGGEIWNDIEVINRPAIVEDFEEGDSQRKVVMGVKNTRRCDRCSKVYGKPLMENGI